MSNLLEKASILLTPTAYDDGKILSVKPEEVLGEELVVNGDFSDGSTSWNFGPGWSIVNENASHTGSGSYIEQGSLTQGVSYKVVINVTQASGSGFPQIYMGGLTTAMTSVGVYTFNIVAVANDKIKIRGLNDCEISSVSVKQEIDGDFDFTRNSSATRVNSQGLIEDVQILSSNLVSNGDFSQEGAEQITNGDFSNGSTDWNLGSGITISGGSANFTGVANANINQSAGLITGKTYKIVFTVSNYVSGNIDYNVGGNTRQGEISANGTYTVYVVSDSGQIFYFQSDQTLGFVGSIDNVSVKEVGQGWILGTGVAIGEDRAIFTSTASGQSVSQNAVASSLTNGALAKVSFEVLSITQGSFGVYFSGTLVGTLASAGVFTGYFTKGTETSFYIRALGTTSGSISNISVIEITDDTNLPRINYEGFSYQDSLGSELVTNGGFATDSNWNKGANWSILNGVATSNGAGLIQQSTSDLTPGKTYKISFEITEYTSGGVKLYSGSGSDASTYKNTVGTHTDTLVLNGNTTSLYSNNFIGSIDNVSVKEYLGQEVVPDSGCGSWLFEPQSTNLVNYSEDFSGWALNDVTVESDSDTSPDGNNKATLIKGNTNVSRHHIRKTFVGSVDGSYSIFAKVRELRYLQIASINNTNQYVNFDLEDGLVGTVGSGFSNAEIKEISDGWYRLSVTSNNVYNSFYISLVSGVNSGWLETWAMSNNTDGLYIWGAQLEQSSFATSYIPTNGSTVTRLQDAAFGAGSSDLINSTEGVLYWEGVYFGASGNNLISVSESGSNNYVALFFLSGSTILSRYYNNGSIQGNTSYGGLNTTDYFKIAFSWSQDNFSLWVNGVRRSLDTSGNIITPNVFNKINFASVSNSQNFFGKTKCLAVFKEALTDAELTCLTTI